jgi:hypothetical protein
VNIIEKEGEEKSLKLWFYGRFLSIITSNNAPITMTAMIVPTDKGRKYRSAMDGACVGIGVGVEGAGSTAKAVTAWDGQ